MSRVARFGSIPLAAASLVAFAGCAQQARFRHSVDLRAPHAATSPIEVRTENGSITLSKAAVSEVEVRADIRAVTQARADATVVTAERTGDGVLLIGVKWPDGKRQSNEACSLDIKVPGAVGVRLFTSNGDIDAKGLAGAGKMETSNGAIIVTDHAGDVDAHSSNGDVMLTRVGGVDAHTSNGRLEVRGATGAVKAETSNGGVVIVLDAANAGPVDAHSSNGSIRLEVGPGFAGVVEVQTSNGSINLTGAGPAQIASSGRHRSTLTFGAGGAASRLETSNGTVTVVGGK